MSALLLLALAGAAQDMPADWARLAPLPYRTTPQVSAAMNAFVRRQFTDGHCTPAAAVRETGTLQVELAVLIDAAGTVRTAVPRAIQCPTVEQYAAGLVTSFARNNLLDRPGPAEQWYRTSVQFALRP